MYLSRRVLLLLAMLAVLFSAVRVIAGELAWHDKATLIHLRSIGQACAQYANENRGFFPKSFGQLSPMLEKPETFLDARLNTLTPKDWAKLSADERREWIDAHCEFDFTDAAGQRVTKMAHPATVPLASTRDQNGVRKLTLFADTHVELGPVPPAKSPTTRP